MIKDQRTEKKEKRRGSRMLLLLLVSFFVFAGCSASKEGTSENTEQKEQTEETTKLYLLNEERTRVISQNYVLQGKTADEQISAFLTALESVLWTEEEKAQLLEKNPIQGFIINDTGVLTLYFAPDYISAGNTTAVLKRAAVVKTLCQIEGVDSVEMYIGTQPMMLANGKPMGMLKAENFIDSTGAETEFYQETQLVIFFASAAGNSLIENNLKVTYDGKISTERLVINQLLNGPLSEQQLPVLPEGTVLNKISIKDGVCHVDFNDAFLKGCDGTLPEVTVYAIVNSLTELTNVYKVQFLINGEIHKTYPGLDMDFSSVFERNLEIVEGEQ